MADRVVVAICILFMAFLIPYLIQWYKAHYLSDIILDEVDVPEDLAMHSEEFEQPNIIMVTKGVYVAIGYALANSILIEAPSGNIIVDTTEAMSSAREIRQAFRNVSDRPIAAIIYTHNHPDHIYGAKAFVDDLNNPPEVWAHHTLLDQKHLTTMTGPLIYRRSMKQFGRFLPNHVNSGIGPRLLFDKDENAGFVTPNKFLYEAQQDVEIAGLPVTLVHIPGETSDQMGVWIPQKEMFLCGDDIYRAFPNLYAIRGTPSRDVMHWVKSLDIIMSFNPYYLVPSHTKPLEGKEYIRDIITSYRDAIQYVHDQTVRYMNKGMHPDDIVNQIKLPYKLRNHPFLKEFYGTVEWSVRGVFSSYMGWFSGDVEDLSPMNTKDKAEKLINLGGSVTSVLNKAKAALTKDDFQWALELSSAVLKIYPGNKKALDLRIKALQKKASKATSANSRNYHLMSIMDDLGRVDNKLDPSKLIMIIPMNRLFAAMATRFMPEACQDYNIITKFDFTDTNEVFWGIIRHGIFNVKEQASKETDGDQKSDLIIRTTSLIWREILSKKRNPAITYLTGDIAMEGSYQMAFKFLGCFDRNQ